MQNMPFLRPRANIPQQVRGRACGSTGAPVRNPRKMMIWPPRCAVHARRRPAARIRARKAARKVCCCREPDPEDDHHVGER